MLSDPGLKEIHGGAMCLPGMAMMLKRLMTLGLTLAFLVGVTVQLVPPSMAETPTSVSAGMPGCCDIPQPPCTGHMPNCLAPGASTPPPAPPVPPTAIAVPVEWTSLVYDFAPQALAGISVKPEL